MSIKEFKLRLKQEVQDPYTQLDQFLWDIQCGDEPYPTALMDRCIEEILVPYFKKLIDEIAGEDPCNQFISFVGRGVMAKIMDRGAVLWSEMLSKMNLFVPLMDFSYKAEIFGLAEDRDSFTYAILSKTQIVQDMYKTLCGEAAPRRSATEMLRHLKTFASINNMELMIRHVLKHEDERVVAFCGDAIHKTLYLHEEVMRHFRFVEIIEKMRYEWPHRFFQRAVFADRYQLDGEGLILDAWVDDGVIAMLARQVIFWSDHDRDLIERVLRRNPFAQATVRNVVERNDLKPKAEGDHDRASEITFLEMIIDRAQDSAEKIHRSSPQFFFLLENSDF